MDPIKVAASSRPSAVAGSIAGIIREHNRVEVQATGAGAVNQAVKAVILATAYLRHEFADVKIDEQERTAIKLVVDRGVRSTIPRLLRFPCSSNRTRKFNIVSSNTPNFIQ